MSVARFLRVPTLQTCGFELDPKYLSYADFTQIFKIQGLYVDFSWILADLTLALPISFHFTICTLLSAGAFHCLAIRMKLLSLCKDMRGVQSSPNRYLGKLVRPFLHKSVMFEIHTNCKGAE